MATTTNYGWTTPDDTALVKDGASAIRTLGTSVDTTTKNLNPETTLGDLAYRSSTSNVNTRLGIGGTGTVLTVAAGVPSWATPSSGSMTLISTTTLSGSSTVLSSIPATYNNLVLIIQKPLLSVDGGALRMRINADTGTRYRDQEFGATNITAATFNRTFLQIMDDNSNATTTGLIQIEFTDYTNTTTFKLGQTTGIQNYSVTTTSLNITARVLAYNQISAISSLTFLPDSGTFTSGTVLLYGVK